MSYPLQHEYSALRRYRVRHYRSRRFKPVDPDWYDKEVADIARLLAHDDRPTETESQAIDAKYLVVTYFPFWNDLEEA